MFRQFGGGRSDGFLKCVKVDIIEHCAVHDSARRTSETCPSGHFAIVDKNVIMRSSNHLNTSRLKGLNDERKEVREDLFTMRVRCNKRDHQIARIGIDTPSPTLALDDSDVMFAAIGFIHLDLCRLMPTIDDGRRDYPCEKRRYLDAFH